jgi:hypothetical protein
MYECILKCERTKKEMKNNAKTKKTWPPKPDMMLRKRKKV